MLRRMKAFARYAKLWLSLGLAAACAISANSQTSATERTFPQSKATVEKALRGLQGETSGRLPVLDGFALAADHPLERYQRAYYQSSVQVSAKTGGGSAVRVSTKVTAWYNDSEGMHSGYQLLKSNGRLETDLLDRLAERLAEAAPANTKSAADRAATPAAATPPNNNSDPAISAPAVPFPRAGGTFSSSVAQGLAAQENAATPAAQKKFSDEEQLRSEAQNLEEILKNQGHPKNLVAVKKSGTPVTPSPSLKAKPLFLASAHDEFEMLDFNADWVHVRVSGLSRGWIWRGALEMPEGIPDTGTAATPDSAPAAAELFTVTRQEAAPFPGDWAPLRGKNVKIISIQKKDEAKDSGPQARLEFAKFLFDKDYSEVADSKDLAGIVLIFDAADGGMIAAPLTVIQQWKAGTLNDAAMLHQCFFDPPETFESSGSSAAQ